MNYVRDSGAVLNLEGEAGIGPIMRPDPFRPLHISERNLEVFDFQLTAQNTHSLLILAT